MAAVCRSAADCSGQGRCPDPGSGSCDCDFLWTGPTCQESYATQYTIYVTVFAILFGLIAVGGCAVLVRSMWNGVHLEDAEGGQDANAATEGAADAEGENSTSEESESQLNSSQDSTILDESRRYREPARVASGGGIVAFAQTRKKRYHRSLAWLQTILIILMIILGMSRTLWLLTDPHSLRGHLYSSIVENLVSGLGLWLILISYLIVVMLWGTVCKAAAMGNGQLSTWSPLRHIRSVYIGLMIIVVSGEVVFRVLLRIWHHSTVQYRTVAAAYYCFMGLIMITAIVSYGVFGVRMRNNLARYDHLKIVTERLSRVTILTTGASGLCLFTLCYLGIVFVIESLIFKFQNLVSFLWEQSGFRLIEILLAVLILYSLWKATAGEKPQVAAGESSKEGDYGSNLPRDTMPLLTRKRQLQRADSTKDGFDAMNRPPSATVVRTWSAVGGADGNNIDDF